MHTQRVSQKSERNGDNYEKEEEGVGEEERNLHQQRVDVCGGACARAQSSNRNSNRSGGLCSRQQAKAALARARPRVGAGRP